MIIINQSNIFTIFRVEFRAVLETHTIKFLCKLYLKVFDLV